MAVYGLQLVRSIISTLQEQENDPDIKRKLNEYLKFNEDDFEKLCLIIAKQCTDHQLNIVDSVAMVAHKDAREESRRKACKLEAQKRLAPTGKTAELLDLIEHFDDDSDNELQQHIDFRNINELIETGEIDLSVTPLYLGSVLTHFLHHVRGAKILENSRCKAQYLKLIETMLDAGVDPNLEDAYGYTAVNYVFDDLDALKLLHEHSADLTHIVSDQFDEVNIKRSILAENIMPLAFVDNFDETEKIIDYLVENGLSANIEPVKEVKACVNAYFDPYTALDESANKCFEFGEKIYQLTSIVAFGFKRRYKMLKGKVTSDEFKNEIADFMKKFMDKMIELYNVNDVLSNDIELVHRIAQIQQECAEIITEVVLVEE